MLPGSIDCGACEDCAGGAVSLPGSVGAGIACEESPGIGAVGLGGCAGSGITSGICEGALTAGGVCPSSAGAGSCAMAGARPKKRPTAVAVRDRFMVSLRVLSCVLGGDRGGVGPGPSRLVP